ncbi:acetyl ornithine aminotransferase family protein [candidate division WOR-3 bacterium]|uniref:Acetyl ornithine aminotransferase family protein n=1 Tax=candidate division WOR-3 bacterium TaxID=2052148 RepID=A0A9D5K9B7_UNCW3|nr:acetyl ornithine aminotransferase family protein [candidate division WOR-3 bacterium]MBD3364848.1 acetyl ornithine aminotransferase family protein [candidate division WOR-3 bacterium]
MPKPEIRKLPGPEFEALVKRDKKYISPSYTRDGLYSAAVERGEGVWVWDVDGNKFLDFAAGIAVCATGHCHPRVVEAIREQAGKLMHMSGTDFYYPPQVNLAEKLAEIVPGSPNKRVFFSNSGAEAVEAGMKLARYHTRRPYWLAYYGAFHGRTFGALSLTSSKAVQREHFAPLVPQVIHVPYPDCYRCVFNETYPGCDFACLKYVEDVVFKREVDPEEVAGFFVEPIQGEGGYNVPPQGYMKALRELLSKHGILFIDDEIQAGMGRTGKMFAIEHEDGVLPDIVTIAKGIASGMPLGATVASSSVMDWQPGAHASTFGGNPVSCAAALATINELESGLVDNAAKVGAYLKGKLEDLAERWEHVANPRGRGLMLAVDITRSKESKESWPEKRNAVIRQAFMRGLIILPCGGCGIRFIPALLVTREEADTALSILADTLKEVFKR